jgi:PIN domain nuclease of toxin-antitoxin system
MLDDLAPLTTNRLLPSVTDMIVEVNQRFFELDIEAFVAIYNLSSIHDDPNERVCMDEARGTMISCKFADGILGFRLISDEDKLRLENAWV